MSNWNEVLKKVHSEAKRGVPNSVDIIRRKYILEIFRKTGRYAIAYYSGWLQEVDNE